MSSPTADPESTRSRSTWTVIAAVIGTLVFGSAIVGLSAAVLEAPVAVGAVAVLTLLAAAFAWRRAAASGETAADGEGSRDVWNAIPSWQYDGRHAESGGFTRGEQESALREIQQQADDIEKRERN
ncbi:hypothetical protein Htur_0158 [Haloterrigena turkmenica DSM 5511]|uniref:Uncharacterized protein n=1 Tax=Haloterrigena turkmenica (strain ATCC 51198 / DSM 5511 / JCM 9101 / NCIMB 13204 / VKM B-1734 / 4k) TaxID=543526 RepID=D2RTL6_HALTV|nr:hypothetical protein [Haloterrigena turkmenica]ADB59059.1 hypothetical protein Htur_0158 [Haloterrigena turkmenica DSM 5511]